MCVMLCAIVFMNICECGNGCVCKGICVSVMI